MGKESRKKKEKLVKGTEKDLGGSRSLIGTRKVLSKRSEFSRGRNLWQKADLREIPEDSFIS